MHAWMMDGWMDGWVYVNVWICVVYVCHVFMHTFLTACWHIWLRQVAAGYYHFVLLRSDGQAFALDAAKSARRAGNTS